MTTQMETPRGLSLPPIQAANLDAQPTPVELDGSFLTSGKEIICEGRQAPIDPETNQPHLVVPAYVTPTSPDHHIPTFHHLRYYREDKHLGAGTNSNIPENLPYSVVAGLAVRIAIGTYLMRSTHERVHDRYPLGPNRPTNIHQKFETAVASAAGIVPRQVIDVTRPAGDELVTPNRYIIAHVAAESGHERFKSTAGTDRAMRALSSFFMRYVALEKDYVSVDDNFVDQVLDTDDMDIRNDMAFRVLSEGVEYAVEPLLPRLEAWRSEGLVLPGRGDAMTELRRIISIKRVKHVLPLLHPEIAKALEAEAA